MVAWASSFWADSGGSPAPKGAAKFITVHFGPGPKKSADHLTYPASSQACSESLGLFDCPNTQNWVWNVEIQARVSDDASQWVATQTVDSERKKGISKSKRGIIHSFDFMFGKRPDGPPSSVLQQNPGEKTIFWIDAPGHEYTIGAGEFTTTIDSMIHVQNFTSKVCMKAKPQIVLASNGFLSSSLTQVGSWIGSTLRSVLEQHH